MTAPEAVTAVREAAATSHRLNDAFLMTSSFTLFAVNSFVLISTQF
jgi:hypothetical protein